VGVENLWLWIGFGAMVSGMLVLDLAVFHRKPHVMSFQEALAWSTAWVSLATLFAATVYVQMGSEKALEFVAGYIIEWSLSVDNLFVFLMIFAYFGVPAAYQHRVLFWGIMGAVIMRGMFIATGAALLAWFHWMVYVFGAFLVLTGLKLLRQGDQHIQPERNPVLRAFRRVMAVTPEYHGQRFFLKLDGHWLATPLIPILIVVETTDVIFAVDSVPAIFAVTRDPFIVYTSNVFAILGLRALFFLLEGIMGLFRYLKIGLCVVLVFVGVKMLVSDFYKIPIGVSLGLVATILAGSVLLSLIGQLVSPRSEAAPTSARGRLPSEHAGQEASPAASGAEGPGGIHPGLRRRN
jgi:tellurite resistance protein TerC